MGKSYKNYFKAISCFNQQNKINKITVGKNEDSVRWDPLSMMDVSSSIPRFSHHINN